MSIFDPHIFFAGVFETGTANVVTTPRDAEVMGIPHLGNASYLHEPDWHPFTIGDITYAMCSRCSVVVLPSVPE